jgi:peptidoglycan/LPS O-acetylase OafA/YrhL
MKSNTRPYARFDALDFYRYAGAIFVALDHYLIVYLPVNPDLISYIGLQLQPLMGFFFTLSGFVITHVYQKITSRAEYIDYLKKRFARMYPLHAATLLIFVICPAFGIFQQWSGGVRVIVPNLLLVHAWGVTHRLTFNYPSWSVSAEWFVYLLFPAFVFMVNRLNLWFALLIPCVFAVLNTCFVNAMGLRPWTIGTFDFGCLRAVPSFIAGIVIYRLAIERLSHVVVPSWLAHGAAIATIPIMLVGMPNQLALAMMVVVVFLLARTEPSSSGILSTPFFRALSNCSYGFYMLHVLVGELVIGQAGGILHLDQGIWKFILVPVALAATTVVSVLSFRFFEDPARRFLGQLKFRNVKGIAFPRSAGDKSSPEFQGKAEAS